MKIAVGSDHRGFESKRRMLATLNKSGHQVTDFGCDGPTACDYPDYAIPVARAVAEKKADVGILFDGSGIGMCITANKIRGIHAGLVHDDVTARRAREHHHCNVLCIGTDLQSEDSIRSIIDVFLGTPLAEGRHDRRVAKIMTLEAHERGESA